MKELEFIGSWPKKYIFAISVTLVIIITTVRLFAGHELALSLFFLVPVSLSSLNAGRFHGFLMAFLSVMCWLAADLSTQSKFANPYIPFVNEFFRLVMFIFIAHIMTSLKELTEEQKKTARTDFLTRIPNRLSFIEYLEIEISKSRRNNRPISMVFLDVDNFKIVNDTWGHHEGDLLLISVATTISHAIRNTDFAARLGGDEFGILLWRSSANDALQVAEKIRTQLLVMARRKNWPVTFSMGLVTFEIPPENVNELIGEADKLMYKAKHSGKNTLKHLVISKNNISSTSDKFQTQYFEKVN